MRRIFADAVYWIALANRKDQWHAKVVQTMRLLGPVWLVTTDDVLSEFLAYYSDYGPALRSDAAHTVEDVLSDPSIAVQPHTRQSFLDGLALYKARPERQ